MRRYFPFSSGTCWCDDAVPPSRFSEVFYARGLRNTERVRSVMRRAGVADSRIIIRPSRVVVSLRWTMLNDTAKSTGRKSVAEQIDTPTVQVCPVHPPAVLSFSSVFARRRTSARRRRTQPRVRADRAAPSSPRHIDLYQAEADYTAAESGGRRRRRRQSNDLLLLPISRRHRIESKSSSD